jgi:hypothetical protein
MKVTTTDQFKTTGMECQSRFYSTPEKYKQPCEINLNIAEYTTSFLKHTTTLQTYQHFPKNIAQHGKTFLFTIKTDKYF